MDYETSLNDANKIKIIGSISILLAGLFVDDSNRLLTDGPGVLSGVCIAVTVVCVVVLAIRSE